MNMGISDRMAMKTYCILGTIHTHVDISRNSPQPKAALVVLVLRVGITS